jgi:hypothetical protein
MHAFSGGQVIGDHAQIRKTTPSRALRETFHEL